MTKRTGPKSNAPYIFNNPHGGYEDVPSDRRSTAKEAKFARLLANAVVETTVKKGMRYRHVVRLFNQELMLMERHGSWAGLAFVGLKRDGRTKARDAAVQRFDAHLIRYAAMRFPHGTPDRRPTLFERIKKPGDDA